MKYAKYLVAIAAFVTLALVGFSAFTTVPEKAAETAAPAIQNCLATREAARNEFPFMVVIDVPGHGQGYGILISPEFVLTTAALVNNSTTIKLGFGVHNLTDYATGQGDETAAVQVVVNAANTVTLHTGWSPGSLADNLAIIQLPSPVALSAAIQPLTSVNESQNYWAGQSIQSIGWGLYLENGAVRVTPTPQVVDVSTVAMPVAISTLGKAYDQASHVAANAPGATSTTSVLVTTGTGGTQLLGLLNESIPGGGMAVYTRLDHAATATWVSQNTGVVFN